MSRFCVLAVTLWLCVLLPVGPATAQGGATASEATTTGSLATFVVQQTATDVRMSFEGNVEAARQTVVAAQIPGAIVMVSVKSGDAVRAGQVLMRIDPRSVDQGAVAGDAQVALARAKLEVARKDMDRQRQLFQSGFISQAGLDGVEAQFKASQAQVAAELAQSGVGHTQAGFALVTAPYAGVVSDVPVSMGDMALPGRPLLTLYDPSAMRVAAALPESVAHLFVAASANADAVLLELSGGAGSAWIRPVRSQVLPAVDAASHTVTVRFDIGSSGKEPTQSRVAPGMFARVWLRSAAAVSATGTATRGVRVPASAIVRRAELTAAYVVDTRGKPHLRQVRLGHVDGNHPDAELVEVLSGLSAGEQIARDPQAAARMR